eukprot:XP_001703497.1 predicted protein [Chlamydomonas reinhardtii]
MERTGSVQQPARDDGKMAPQLRSLSDTLNSTGASSLAGKYNIKSRAELYKGSVSTVFKCQLVGGSAVVVKQYHKAKMQDKHFHKLARELNDTFEDSASIYLVMECCEGGDLFKKLMLHGGRLPEGWVAAEVIAPLLQVLHRMHALRIMHRDIKPENIFLTAEGDVKLGDFGLAIDWSHELAFSRSGTLDYMAPEVLINPATHLQESAAVTAPQLAAKNIRPYTAAVDVWAVGCLAYELVSGRPPFEVEDEKQTASNIIYSNNIRFDPAYSAAWADFVAQALIKDPRRRPTAAALLAHPWLAAHRIARSNSGGTTAGSLRSTPRTGPQTSQPQQPASQTPGSLSLPRTPNGGPLHNNSALRSLLDAFKSAAPMAAAPGAAGSSGSSSQRASWSQWQQQATAGGAVSAPLEPSAGGASSTAAVVSGGWRSPPVSPMRERCPENAPSYMPAPQPPLPRAPSNGRAGAVPAPQPQYWVSPTQQPPSAAPGADAGNGGGVASAPLGSSACGFTSPQRMGHRLRPSPTPSPPRQMPQAQAPQSQAPVTGQQPCPSPPRQQPPPNPSPPRSSWAYTGINVGVAATANPQGPNPAIMHDLARNWGAVVSVSVNTGGGNPPTIKTQVPQRDQQGSAALIPSNRSSSIGAGDRFASPQRASVGNLACKPGFDSWGLPVTPVAAALPPQEFTTPRPTGVLERVKYHLRGGAQAQQQQMQLQVQSNLQQAVAGHLQFGGVAPVAAVDAV